MGSSSNPPFWGLGEGGVPERLIVVDPTEYPYSVPSFSPSITNVKNIQHLLQDSKLYSDTRCDLLEASARGCTVRHVDEEGLRGYLRDCNTPGIDKVCLRAL